jgi:hypothetical protein
MPVLGYYSPNDSILVSAITDGDKNCNVSELSQCPNVQAALSTHNTLVNQLQTTTSKNNTSEKLYTDSNVFYSTQYIQLWNMAGGILIAGVAIYFLVKQKK